MILAVSCEMLQSVPQSSWPLAELSAVALSLSCRGEPRSGCGAPGVGCHMLSIEEESLDGSTAPNARQHGVGPLGCQGRVPGLCSAQRPAGPHILFWKLSSSCMAPSKYWLLHGAWHFSCWTAQGSWQPIFQVPWMEAQPSGASASSAGFCVVCRLVSLFESL